MVYWTTLVDAWGLPTNIFQFENLGRALWYSWNQHHWFIGQLGVMLGWFPTNFSLKAWGTHYISWGAHFDLSWNQLQWFLWQLGWCLGGSQLTYFNLNPWGAHYYSWGAHFDFSYNQLQWFIWQLWLMLEGFPTNLFQFETLGRAL